MTHESQTAEPTRPADAARLELAKLHIGDSVPLQTFFQRMTETTAKVLDVERVGVWLFSDTKEALRCIDLFEKSKGTHSSGTMLQTVEFPEYFESLGCRRTIPAEVAVEDHRTSGLAEAYLIPLGIISLLDAPIYVGGEVIGVLCHEHTGEPREWTTEQRDFASSMADLLAVKIRAAEAQDLRKLVRVQSAQLAESRRANDLADTAAGISHDFKNILTIMLGNTELLTEHPAFTPALAYYTSVIQEAGYKGVALATAFMELANPGPSSSRVVRPAKVISAQLPLLKSAVGERHKVCLEVQSSEGRVLIDPAQLERAIHNLVINARDAEPDGGTVTVSVNSVTEPDDDGKPSLFYLISVKDHGTGIPPDVLPRIFDPYFTTKPRGLGTGVGLAVVQQIVTYAGGYIRVDSTVGQGTTFRVYLPQISNS